MARGIDRGTERYCELLNIFKDADRPHIPCSANTLILAKSRSAPFQFQAPSAAGCANKQHIFATKARASVDSSVRSAAYSANMQRHKVTSTTARCSWRCHFCYLHAFRAIMPLVCIFACCYSSAQGRWNAKRTGYQQVYIVQNLLANIHLDYLVNPEQPVWKKYVTFER